MAFGKGKEGTDNGKCTVRKTKALGKRKGPRGTGRVLAKKRDIGQVRQ